MNEMVDTVGNYIVQCVCMCVSEKDRRYKEMMEMVCVRVCAI